METKDKKSTLKNSDDKEFGFFPETISVKKRNSKSITNSNSVSDIAFCQIRCSYTSGPPPCNIAPQCRNL